MSAELATQDQQPSIAGMLQTAIAQGVTSDNADALGKMLDVYERMEARNAEKEFAKSFVAMQSEMPAVQAVAMVPNRDGTLRYKFAPYEEIMATVRPLLQKHGFSVTFDVRFAEGRMNSICTLMHIGGHSRKNEFGVRIGSGPPGSNEMQADGAAKTYAKRGALCDALNIVVTADTDGDDQRGLGKKISQADADFLRGRVKATACDEKKFLDLAKASSYEDIDESQYEMLDQVLKKREVAKGK